MLANHLQRIKILLPAATLAEIGNDIAATRDQLHMLAEHAMRPIARDFDERDVLPCGAARRGRADRGVRRPRECLGFRCGHRRPAMPMRRRSGHRVPCRSA